MLKKIDLNKKYLLAIVNCLLALFLVSCNADKKSNEDFYHKQEKRTLEIGNKKVKATFVKDDNSILQTFYAKKGNEWKEIATSFVPKGDFPEDAVQLFNASLDPKHRFLVNALVNDFELVENEEGKAVKLTGNVDGVPVTQVVSLQKDQDYFHFEVFLTLKEAKPKLDYALSTFTFNLDRAPAFIHTPGLKFDNEDSQQHRFKILPGKDQVIGDRAYHAPAVILQDKGLFSALVPDLNNINQNQIQSPDARKEIFIESNRFGVPVEQDKYTMPTGLDLNVMSGLTPKPVMTFGYMDNIITHHIRYQRRNDSSMVRTLETPEVKYAFDLFIGAETPENRGFQQVAQHQWQQYGKPVFEDQRHLAMPFDEYFKIVDSITFNPITYTNINIDLPIEGYRNTGSWLEWEENGQKMGGYRSAIDRWNDAMHNSVFWNNAREAQGFWYWGEKLNRPDIKEKAKRIINLCLSAPRTKEGLFPTLYYARDKKWEPSFTDPVNGNNRFFLRDSDTYIVYTMSKTAAHLLDYYQRCEQDERIVEYFKPYGNWLLEQIDDRGAVPSYVDERNMKAMDIFTYSAHPAASMWFLAELYNTTKEQKYLDGALKISKFMDKEILPEQKWVDMEQFFSCGNRPLHFKRDRWQNQIARGTLVTYWAIDGYTALYKATRDRDFLNKGESCIDYVSFYQCVWDPHYIYTAFPFGGFSVDNADNGTYMDARQAEMVRPYIWYGKQLQRQDLLERAVAAARSSVVLINHPRHKSNNIYRHTNIYPYGLGPENIDHEAYPQSAMRTHPSWGEGSGVFTGLAEVQRGLGGIYLDFDKNLFVGVDGIKVMEVKLEGAIISMELENRLGKLTEPWGKAFEVELRMIGLEDVQYQLKINGKELGEQLGKTLRSFKIKVTTDGDFELKKV